MTTVNKVRAGSIYTFRAVGLDVWDARHTARDGQRVRVVNLPGAPRCNVMGHCHIQDEQTGAFLGLVLTNSLSR